MIGHVYIRKTRALVAEIIGRDMQAIRVRFENYFDITEFELTFGGALGLNNDLGVTPETIYARPSQHE